MCLYKCKQCVSMVKLHRVMNKLFVFVSLFLLLFTAIPLKNVSAETQQLVSSQAAFIKYDLSYPGILPDNPFYKLKVIRDKIVSFLITNPDKKVDFYLLQTDKGILAAAMLVDKNKIKLAEETILKAENNFTFLTFQLGRFAKKPDESFFSKLKTASLKHQEVIKSLISRVPKNEKKVFENVLYFSERNLKTVEEYKARKDVRNSLE